MQPMVKCLPSILRRSSCQACTQDKLSLWIMRASMKEKKCGKRLKPKAVTCCFYRPIRPISRPLKRLSPSSKPFYVVSGHVLPKNFKKQLYMLYKKLLLMMLMDGFATVAMNSQLKKKSFRWDEPGPAFGEPLYWGLRLIAWIHRVLGAVAVVAFNPKNLKNRSCLPPTWTREELGKRSAIERFFGRVFLFFHLQRPPLTGWSEVASQVALTYAASVIVGLAAQQAGRPDLIRSPKRVLAHLWEGDSQL